MRNIHPSMGTGVDGIGTRLSGSVNFTVSEWTHATADVLMKGLLLLKNLCEALDMVKQCEEICGDFKKHRPPATVHSWKMMKRKWEIDPSQPDLYALVEKGRATVCITLLMLTLSLRSFKPQFCKTKAFGT